MIRSRPQRRRAGTWATGWWAPAPAAPARPAFASGQRVLLLAAFAALIALRLPHAWTHGRFYDEEATVFLAYAWHHPWSDALLRPFAGYWNLGATATTVVTAALVKHGMIALERAPYLTMTMALAVQLLPGVLILTGRASWLARRAAVVAALLLVATTTATEEVFLNVLHIQFHLALCAALILALDPPPSRGARWGHDAVLVAAPLCGPGAITLLPLFVARALADRDRARGMQAAALTAGAAIQLALFFGASPMRAHLFNPTTLAAVFLIRLIVLPVAGNEIALKIGAMLWNSWRWGGWGWLAGSAIGAALLAGLLIATLRRRDGAAWLVLSALAIAVVSFGAGMVVREPLSYFYATAGERYNFLPAVLLGLALVAMAARAGRRRSGAVWSGLIAVVLATGALHYRHAVDTVADGPSWPREVAAWRRDHGHPLAVWPRPWAADLSDITRPCTPVAADPARSTDPRYCESGWVAGFYRPKTKR